MAFLDSLFAPPGLLNPEEQAFVRNQGLLNLAGSLLAASGPSPRPISLGQALGQGLSGMSQATNQATQGVLGNRLLKTKLDEVEMEKKRQKGLLDLVGAPAGLIANDAQGDEMVDRPGTGYLGGKLTPQQFYAGIAGLGGDYTKTGLGAMSAMQTRGEYYVPVQTANGVVFADTRRGRFIDPMTNQEIRDRRIIGSASDPSLQAQIAGGKEAAKTEAEITTKAKLDLPTVEANSKYAIELLDKLKAHPGLSASVGPEGILPKIPGTKQADFITLLEQVQGKQFLEAYQTLKGAGQITEVEGAKAEKAIARMSRAQTEKAFIEAATEFQDVIRAGTDRAKQKAGQSAASQTPKVRRYNPATGKIE